MSELLSCEQWVDELDQKVEKMPRVQSRLANFELLPRLGQLLEEKQQECPDCKLYWQKLQDSTVLFEEFFDDGNEYLTDFEKVVDEIMTHLKENHGIRPKGLILSYRAVLMMAVGVLVGYFIGLIFPIYMKAGVIMGWCIGTMVGWFWGKRIEKKMTKSNKIF